MGSLTSRPKSVVTSTPQVVYVPASQPDPTPVIEPSTPSAADTAEQDAQEQREDNLLRRDRGRGGTIQTGFRGVLSAVQGVGQKKTLLGQ